MSESPNIDLPTADCSSVTRRGYMLSPELLQLLWGLESGGSTEGLMYGHE